jgi:NADPH-dependent glutamate synthase beta subunit-like oxidoreductase
MVPACSTPVQPGMRVLTQGTELCRLRQQRLSTLLAAHPHACLTCAQREGCTREPCSMNVPREERCCELLGRCELQAVAEHVGIDPSTPRYVPAAERDLTDTPLFERSPALCIGCGRCVRACQSREVHALGWARDSAGTRWVGPLASTPVQAGCRLCGSCVEVCPTGALLDRGVKPAERQQALVPCRTACPAGTDVPRYVRLVAEGKHADAAAVVAERAPLVEVLGQVCFHPCEAACRRKAVNGAPISICRIKREAGAASAARWAERLPAPPTATGHTVAVVGGGPAGLTAVHLLRLLGHRVTLFERHRRLGGMLEHGIPPFRLSREVLEREIEALLAAGTRDGSVTVRAGVSIGGDGLSVSQLRTEHSAVVVATGAPEAVGLGVPGEELPGVQSGLGFLHDLSAGRLQADALAGQAVVVVGGGNVAMDCARAAMRLKATSVEVVCLEPMDAMPAYADEVLATAAEGVGLHNGWGIRALSGNGSVAAVELKRCTRVLDEAGRFAPQYDEGTLRRLRADSVVVAVGQQAERGLVPVALDGVFLAGDVATGPRSVVEAIASGREAALATDRYLGGSGELGLALGPTETPTALGRVEGFCTQPRLEPEQDTDRLGPQRAQQEADRCLRCDLRLSYRPVLLPPAREARLPLDEEAVEQVPAAEGVVRFYDSDGDLLEIVGGGDMRQEIADRLGEERAATFDFEPCPMYTQRQNELLSQYMETHGKMPPGVSDDDDLDDLF